ncbi:MAG: phosphatidylinositol-binding protein scs2 [Phylliscum demangeonii]|nr:MAG: phosphatidylinositol-binding protein scs2 [Phylliscum demangeonii]
MSIELTPSELSFQRPFTREVAQTLRLRNPNAEPVAFKVKTTAPKQYCVRPNSGRIEVGQEAEVQVLLQAMKEDPPLDMKCRDKFLVQAVAIAPHLEDHNIVTMWQHIEQTSRGAIQEKKIRVTWLPPDGVAHTPMGKQVNGTVSVCRVTRGEVAPAKGIQFHDTPMSDPPAYQSPGPDAGTPSRPAPVGPVSVPDSRPADARHLGDARASAFNPTTDGAPDAATSHSLMESLTSAATNALPLSMDDVKAQLAEARDTIVRLSQQAQDGVLRQRKPDGAADARDRVGSGTTVMGAASQRQTAQGVPVQIVAGLCVLSFLLAYLFF